MAKPLLYLPGLEVKGALLGSCCVCGFPNSVALPVRRKGSSCTTIKYIQYTMNVEGLRVFWTKWRKQVGSKRTKVTYPLNRIKSEIE